MLHIVFETFFTLSVFSTCIKLCIWDHSLLHSSNTSSAGSPPPLLPQPPRQVGPVDHRDWDPVDLREEAAKKGICGWRIQGTRSGSIRLSSRRSKTLEQCREERLAESRFYMRQHGHQAREEDGQLIWCRIACYIKKLYSILMYM